MAGRKTKQGGSATELGFHESFETTVLTGLAELKVGLAAVNDHLARLNGSVAKHEQAITGLNAREAATTAGKAVDREWMNRAKPAIWATVGIFFYFILRDAPGVMRLFFK